MGRLIATIKYGSLKTRLFLLAVFLLLAGGGALAVYGGVRYELWALALGALMLIAGLVMVLVANFASVAIDPEDEDDDDGAQTAERRHRRDHSSDTFGKHTDKGEKGAKRSRKRASGDDADDFEISETDDLPDNFAEIDFPGGSGESEEPLKSRRRKTKERDDTEADEDAQPDQEKKTDTERSNGRTERAERNTPENNNELVGKYTPVVFKSILHHYKVKRDYIPIIIDDSRKFDTAKTPALCWVKRKKVFFLLMEGNERVENMPLDLFLQVTYKREVKENNLAAYSKIKDDMGIYEKFEDVMPTFNAVQSRLGVSSYTKNQYVLGGTVAVTPRSMRALRSKYHFDMKLFDSMGISGEHSIYFKRAVEARVLWTDQVIGQQEYQNMIGAILQQMVDDRNIGRYDFLDDLEKMVENRLITSEYADYYMQQRGKRDRDTRK